MPDANKNFEISPVIDTSAKLENYTRRSEGFQGDTSLGTMVKGAADLLTMAVKGTDTYIKQVSTEEIQTQVDEVRDEAIVQRKAAVNLNDPDIPAQLKQEAKELNKIDTAKQQGKLRDSYYWARMDLIARGMRAKYPGYREHIDNTIASMLGTTPANALVRELGNQADALAKKAGGDDEGKWRWNFIKEKGEYLPEEAIKAEGTANQWDKNLLVATALRGERDDLNVRRAKAEFELRRANRSETQEQVSDVANMEAHQLFTKSFAKFEPTIRQIIEESNTDRANNAGVNSPEFIQKAQLALTQAKEQFIIETTKMASDPVYAGLERGKLQQITESYKKLIDGVITSVQEGTLDRTAKDVKIVMDNSTYLALASDQIRYDTALKNLLGPEMARDYLNAYSTKDRAQSAIDLVRRNIMTRIATEGLSATDAARFGKINKIPDKEISNMLRAGHDLLKEPRVPKGAWTNVFKSLYGPDGDPNRILSLAKNNLDAKTIYERWTTPAVAKAIQEREKEIPGVTERYRNWLTNASQIVFKRELDTIRDTTTQGAYVTIDWVNGQFVAKPKVGSDSILPNIDSPTAISNMWNSTRLEGINTIVKRMTPLWNELKLDPKNEALKMLTRNMEGSDTKDNSGLVPFRDLLKKDTKPLQLLDRGNLDEFMNDFNKEFEKDIGERDFDSISRIVDFVQNRLQYTPGERESTNVEDARAGRFAAPRLLPDFVDKMQKDVDSALKEVRKEKERLEKEIERLRKEQKKE